MWLSLKDDAKIISNIQYEQIYIEYITLINNMNLSDRISLIVEYSGKNLSEFSRLVGFKTPQTVRELIKGNTKRVSDSVESKILSAFPQINREWLLTGEGEMLRDLAESKEPELEPEISYTEGVPYFDEDFMLGFEEIMGPANEHPSFLIRMPGYERATLWCNASGHSMEPEISNGDIIALQRVEDFSFLPFGDVYGIITTNGMRTIKRLGRSAREGFYRLIPTNKDYDEQDIPISQIAMVYRVMGAMKPF